ncbi:MAG: hypothetical protein CVT66_10265 [Actinobacteria bacterium HGW-Actinobacteria-6]|nr:MAG: hypothetical protein CVT66_10265 [Actinobacteria bacterium HGW-Actinobacteria-6]
MGSELAVELDSDGTWGRVTSTTGTGIAARNPLRYRAYYADVETGLYYMPARYYDPATYRFLSADPAAPSAGDPASLNVFAYCGDDPIGAIDPDGARAEAGGGSGGGGIDHYEVNSSDIVFRLVGMGWRIGDAHARARTLRASTAHQSWLAERAKERKRWEDGMAARAAQFRKDMAAYNEEQRARETRSSWSTTAPQDDPIGYGLSTAGAMCDVLTVATGPTGVGAAAFGAVGLVLSGVQLVHEGVRWCNGDATAADVALALAGAVPLVDDARYLSYSYHLTTWGISTASYSN